MLVTIETAQYVYNVVTALASGKTFPQMTNQCPECDSRVDLSDDLDHIVFDTNPEDRDALVIIVACEGYWMIDPNAVGIVSEGWMRIDEHFAEVSETPTIKPEVNATIPTTWGPWGDDGRAGV